MSLKDVQSLSACLDEVDAIEITWRQHLKVKPHYDSSFTGPDHLQMEEDPVPSQR